MVTFVYVINGLTNKHSVVFVCFMRCADHLIINIMKSKAIHFISLPDIPSLTVELFYAKSLSTFSDFDFT